MEDVAEATGGEGGDGGQNAQCTSQTHHDRRHLPPHARDVFKPTQTQMTTINFHKFIMIHNHLDGNPGLQERSKNIYEDCEKKAQGLRE